MSEIEFNHFLSSLGGLSPEQIAALRRGLDQLAQPGQAATPPQATAHKPIWEVFQELSADVPEEEWENLPADLAEQHDHYLYYTPKRPPG